VGWICIVVLVITGFTNLHFRGLLEAELLAAVRLARGG